MSTTTTYVPEMRPVTSGNIHSIGYDADGRALFVRFKRRDKTGAHPGALYRYSEVPAEIHEKLLAADIAIMASKALNEAPIASVNRTFDSLVKGAPGFPRFPFERVEG
jgi:hypothetical protein